MNDDLLTALRADLDAFVGEPGPPPAMPQPPVGPVADGSRRPWLALGAAAATIAVVVTGLAVIARRDDPEVGDAPPPAATMPVPPTPDGWTVIEWGDLRLSVPPDMAPFDGRCGRTTKEVATEPVTRYDTLDCSDLGFSVQFDVDPGFIDASGDTEVNGLSQARSDGDCANCDITQSVLVRDLRLDLFFHELDTDLAWSIADTVGVSSAWRAANEPAPPVPDDWQTVTYEGVSLRVPADWPVATWTDPEPRFCLQAGDVVRPGVFLGRGPVSEAAADCAGPVWLMPPTDGVRIYEVDTTVDLPTLPIGERLVTGDRGQQILVRVGFGVDGTIGRTILGSIAGPNAPAPTVTTAPDGREPVVPIVQIEYQGTPYVIEIDRIPWPEDPADWVPVEWGQIRFALPPELSPFAPQTGCAASTWGEFEDHLRITCGNTTIEAGPDLLADAPIVGTTDTIPVANPDADTIASPIYGGLRIIGVDEATRALVLTTATVSTGWRAQNTYVGDDVSPWPTPAEWQRVRHGDMEFAVPPDWPVTDISGEAADPDQCSFVKGDESLPGAIPTDAVLLGRGAVTGDADCDQPVLAPLRNGVRAFSTTESERPSGVSAYDQADQALGGVSASGTIVRVGIGADQLTALTILGSVRIIDERTEYEAIGMVVDAGVGGPMLCSATLESLPPQCAGGVPLDGWSWDVVEGELDQAGTTWLDGVWVTGLYDASTSASLTVIEAHPATDADLARITGTPAPEPDFSVLCAEPTEGWPARNAEWLAEQIEAIPGFAGAWPDVTQQVVTVKFTGDLDAAREAVTQYYPDAICLVPARYSAQELSQIATELLSMSSVQVFSTVEMVDATGEWVDATIAAPTPDLQAALDDRYGTGTVRLRSYLVPVPAL